MWYFKDTVQYLFLDIDANHMENLNSDPTILKWLTHDVTPQCNGIVVEYNAPVLWGESSKSISKTSNPRSGNNLQIV